MASTGRTTSTRGVAGVTAELAVTAACAAPMLADATGRAITGVTRMAVTITTATITITARVTSAVKVMVARPWDGTTRTALDGTAARPRDRSQAAT
jgi:hypothetical protein